MSFFSTQVSAFYKIYSKIRYRLFPPAGKNPESERMDAVLPEDGMSISVETALNSRCTSDYDNNPKYFHWGMFDPDHKLTDAQIELIRQMTTVPLFTPGRAEIRSNGNMLSFIVGNTTGQPARNQMMIEDGMQQQAVGLVCAALGVGYVFNSLGEKSRPVSDNQYMTMRIKLDAMKPGYRGSYWSSDAPGEPKPWLSGNLPEPVRHGTKPLVDVLAKLKIAEEKARPVSENDLSQVLWAARGRTPHYYKSQPWGMTIPTNHGQQNNSSLYLMKDDRVYLYVNWANNRPTHSLVLAENVHGDMIRINVAGLLPQAKSYLIIAINETNDHSYWEAGYQLLNILLQAKALDLAYRAVLLKDEQIKDLRTTGINNAVAAIGI